MADTKLLPLCATGDVEDDTPCQVDIDGFLYAVFKLGDAYHVMADQCTHGPGSLAEGAVIGTEIECPFHQGRFDIVTGQPTAPPCTEAVRVWAAHVVEGQVCIDPAETS